MDKSCHGGAAVAIVQQLARQICNPAAAIPIYPMLVVREIETRGWSSATFDGEKHRLTLRLCGGGAAAIGEALERLVELLPDFELELPGQLVAEVRLVALALDPDPGEVGILMTIDALTVID